MGLYFEIFIGLLTLLLIVVSTCIIYARWNYGTLEALGIPVVKTHFFLGSYPNSHKINHIKIDIERSKKYGPVYGVYNGRSPQIHVTDPNLLRQIMSKDFEHFRNHCFDEFQGSTLFSFILDLLNDDTWKTVRSHLTPAFTSGKLRVMTPITAKVADELCTKVLIKEAQTNAGRIKKFEFREFLAPMLLDNLARCLCGIEIADPLNPKNEFINQMKDALLHDWPAPTVLLNLTNVFPILRRLEPAFEDSTFDFLVVQLTKVLDEREKFEKVTPPSAHPNDTIKILLEMRKKVNTPEFKALGVTEKTVMAQGFEFFSAAYVGIRDSLMFLMYELAVNTRVQDRVLDELDQALAKTQGQIASEVLDSTPYLGGAIEETQRKWPTFNRIDRRCTQDWEFEGLRISKGSQVIIPAVALHYNEKYFPEPTSFQPERFLPENRDQIVPYSLMSFGMGPRGCIGSRLALQTIKIIAASILKEFKIVKREDTRVHIKVGYPLIQDYEKVYVDLVKRTY